MKNPESGKTNYSLAIYTWLAAAEALNSLPTDGFGSFDDLLDADRIAAAYKQIADALETLEEVGVPFAAIEKRMAGMPLQAKVCRQQEPQSHMERQAL
jgi:hypothetical protein